MSFQNILSKLSKHRRRRLATKTVLFVLFVIVTVCPIYYVMFVTQPNYLKSQVNGSLNVRHFQDSDRFKIRYEDLKENQSTSIIQETAEKRIKAPLNGKAVSHLAPWIVKTHQANGTLHHKLTVEKLKQAHSHLCPILPKELVGQLAMKDAMQNTAIPDEYLKLISTGGLFNPQNCTAREKLAVIIPYRDRETHLQVLLAHLHTILQRQKIQYGIYVIEMAYPTQFNRGLLANVGFLTASSIADYTCYIIHDVDLLMTDDRNLYRCGRVSRHLVASSSKYEDSIPYLSYFGGVTAFTTNQFWSVNGFSNLFFGWSGEDDDMVSRIISSGSHFSRPKKTVGGYVTLTHNHEDSNPINPNRLVLLYSSAQRKKVDGVRQVKYNRLALEFKQLYTWVLISVKEAKIMEKYQEYLQIPERKANQTTTVTGESMNTTTSTAVKLMGGLYKDIV